MESVDDSEPSLTLEDDDDDDDVTVLSVLAHVRVELLLSFRASTNSTLPGMAAAALSTVTSIVLVGETSLSFLGLGLRPPVVSWGVMMQDCMNMQVVANYPWLLTPVVFIIMTVLIFNFLGDGMRDAADPYSSR